MRLWIGIHLPLLSLQTFRPRWSEPGLYAVIDHETILITSDAATEHGVRLGMRRASALAISPGIVLLERDLNKEKEAFNSIALALLQYTPEVTFAEDDSILLDVTTSLNVFGGRLALCRSVAKSIAVLGFTGQIGCAPTARGAWLLARSARSPKSRLRRTLKMSSMIKRLNVLPCALLPTARPYQEWLQGIGCRSIGDLRKLPRAGLQRRTSVAMLVELDQAYGMAPELFEWVKPPEIFSAKLEMPDRIDYAEALIFAARRLIAQMIGWLVASQKAVSHLVFWLTHERGRYAIPPTSIEIKLAEPTWREEHIVRLLKEQLNRLELIAPVIGMQLETMQISPMLIPTESLFPEPGGTVAEFNRLLELLKARLGDDGVLCPAPVADHRPEVSNHWVPAVIPSPARGRGAGEREEVLKITSDVILSTSSLSPPNGDPLPRAGEGTSSLLPFTTSPSRPCFLLAQPIALLMRDHRPFYGSPLQLIQGPERIEAGWWDGQFVVRDYFVAQSSDAACYWVYRERVQQDVRWFLHGLFA